MSIWILKFIKKNQTNTEQYRKIFTEVFFFFLKKITIKLDELYFFYPPKQKQIIADNFGYERPKITFGAIIRSLQSVCYETIRFG